MSITQANLLNNNGFEKCMVGEKGWMYVDQHYEDRREGKQLFGAIVAGRAVRFHDWDEDLTLRVISGKGPPLYIYRQCSTIMAWVEYIRGNHV